MAKTHAHEESRRRTVTNDRIAPKKLAMAENACHEQLPTLLWACAMLRHNPQAVRVTTKVEEACEQVLLDHKVTTILVEKLYDQLNMRPDVKLGVGIYYFKFSYDSRLGGWVITVSRIPV
jgi:hypothetical protein